MSSFLAYSGGKMRLADAIVATFGPHRTYLEPFCGTASVLFAKPRARYEIVNDIDGRLVTLLRVVRDRPADLARALALTPYGKAEYYAADPDAADLDDVEIARRVCVRVGQSFAKVGLAEPSKGWRISVRGGRSDALTFHDLPDRVMAACERLRGVYIENSPALPLITRYGAEEDGLLYVDPPYVGDTRNASRMYRHEMRDDDEHRHLADALKACAAHVVLSGYASDLYEDLYEGWHRIEMPARANHNGEVGSDVRRTEVLWSNRPPAAQGSLLDEGRAA